MENTNGGELFQLYLFIPSGKNSYWSKTKIGSGWVSKMQKWKAPKIFNIMSFGSLMFHFSYEEAIMCQGKWKKEVERRNSFGRDKILNVVLNANSWSTEAF